MTPTVYRIAERRTETRDTATLVLEPCGTPIGPVRAGQFAMVYAFGVGEAPISVSRAWPRLELTIRDVGAVSRALVRAAPGATIGVRGPYGVGWGVEDVVGHDLVFAAGGIGLAPLRLALLHALEHRADYGDMTLFAGARTPDDLIYTAEFSEWRERGVRLAVTVDRPIGDWPGDVGLITPLIRSAGGLAGAVAFVCGPEVMMRVTARALAECGVADIRISLERNMRCGIGWCGHCQLGPLLVCRDGPVVPYERAGPLLSVTEL